MSVRLALCLLLTAASASAQTAAPAVRPVVTLSAGPLLDAGGVLASAQGTVGVRAGRAGGRIRGTAATNLALYANERARWEVAALVGVQSGDRTQVFLGAGPGVSGGTIHRECYRTFDCSDDETTPATFGLALGAEATRPLGTATRVGIQASATLNRTASAVVAGVLLQFGR